MVKASPFNGAGVGLISVPEEKSHMPHGQQNRT